MTQETRVASSSFQVAHKSKTWEFPNQSSPTEIQHEQKEVNVQLSYPASFSFPFQWIGFSGGQIVFAIYCISNRCGNIFHWAQYKQDKQACECWNEHTSYAVKYANQSKLHKPLTDNVN